jgi:hypothetical protein
MRRRRSRRCSHSACRCNPRRSSRSRRPRTPSCEVHRPRKSKPKSAQRVELRAASCRQQYQGLCHSRPPDSRFGGGKTRLVPWREPARRVSRRNEFAPAWRPCERDGRATSSARSHWRPLRRGTERLVRPVTLSAYKSKHAEWREALRTPLTAAAATRSVSPPLDRGARLAPAPMHPPTLLPCTRMHFERLDASGTVRPGVARPC